MSCDRSCYSILAFARDVAPAGAADPDYRGRVGKRAARSQVAIDESPYVFGHRDSQSGRLLFDPGVLLRAKSDLCTHDATS